MTLGSSEKLVIIVFRSSPVESFSRIDYATKASSKQITDAVEDKKLYSVCTYVLK